MEAVKSMIEENRERYKKNLEARMRELEAILSGITSIAAHSTNVSAKAYQQASQNPKPTEACSKLTKSGVHIHGRMAVEAAKAVMALQEQIYQTGVVFDHIQSLEDEDQEDI